MSDIKLVRSSGHERLDRETLKRAEKFKFRPAKGVDGKAIDMCDPPHYFTWLWDLP